MFSLCEVSMGAILVCFSNAAAVHGVVDTEVIMGDEDSRDSPRCREAQRQLPSGPNRKLGRKYFLVSAQSSHPERNLRFRFLVVAALKWCRNRLARFSTPLKVLPPKLFWRLSRACGKETISAQTGLPLRSSVIQTASFSKPRGSDALRLGPWHPFASVARLRPLHRLSSQNMAADGKPLLLRTR